ncbi:MAG TPA: hypothetical protein VJR22_05890 [Candidatus Nitrosotalea sp.]|nr:hypothetical protein [Candidatus Nitrosotalea sp.]
MKILYLAITITIYVIAIIVGTYLFEFNQKTPITHMQTNQTSQPPSVSNIIIPDGAEDPSSGKNYEPRYLVVVLGINNTVKWTNESPSAAHTIVADNQDDPLFWNVTRSNNGVLLLPGKSFNFTFTKVGEFQYDTDPHPWMYGWVLVLPQSDEKAIQTVTLNASSNIPDPCETFRVPCPLHSSNYNFTAQKFGSDIYIEKFTGNGVDYYAIIKPHSVCYYPSISNDKCKNPDDLTILRLVGVDTSISQQYADIIISGLKSQYVEGEPISFELKINGYGYDACEIPHVSVLGYNGSTVWQSLKSPWISCIPGRGYHNTVIEMYTLGGPFSINQTGTYTAHVDYASNSTEAKFDVVPKTVLLTNNTTNKITSKSVCGQFYAAPENLRQSNTVPVLLMQSNSTACTRLTFTITSNYKDCNGKICQNIVSLDSTLHIGNLHYEKHDNMFSVSSGKDYTNSFNITTIPHTIDLDNHPIGTNFTVTYVIKPLSNATGFYDQSIPKLACERYPLAVGYPADHVNASNFSYIDTLNPPCASWVYTLSRVEISGMDYKQVTLGS